MTSIPPGVAPAAANLVRRCHVFHLGLSQREVLVIESLLRLRPALQRQYRFAPATEAFAPDVLFVDGDDAHLVAEWQAFHAAHPDSVAVFVSAESSGGIAGIALARPLSFRNLDEVAYALAAATPAAFSAAERTNNLRVLVVDDSAVARDLLHARLEAAAGNSSFPLQVDFADSGEEALAKTGAKPYDLVFLDVTLPGIDGFEVCRQIKQVYGTRIALISSNTGTNDYARGHAAGCDHYMAKPAPADLVGTVVRLTSLKKAMPTH